MDSTDVYNPGANQWLRGKPILTSRERLGGGIATGPLGPVFVVAGGGTAVPTAATEGYSILNDGWTVFPAMPAARSDVGAAVSGLGVLHVLGGAGSAGGNSHFGFDFLSNTWTTLEPMPTARHSLAVAGLLDAVYAIGGGLTAGGAPTAVVEVFVERPVIRGSCGGGLVNRF